MTALTEYKDRLEHAMARAGVDVRKVADALGVSYQAVKKIIDGKSKMLTADNNAQAAKFLGVDSDWLATGKGRPERRGDETGKVNAPKVQVPAGTGVAQPMSLTNIKVAPQRVQWRNLMSLELPDEFRTEAPDDALAPRLRAGQGLTLDTRVQPRAGDAVLVSDRTGALHLRIYTPGVGRWEGQVENKAYLVLDSERDGLQVKAVLTAVEGRWG
jgi:transcriptional regulator with XRE-family HTH domain